MAYYIYISGKIFESMTSEGKRPDTSIDMDLFFRLNGLAKLGNLASPAKPAAYRVQIGTLLAYISFS